MLIHGSRPGLETSILAVEPETAVGLGLSPSLPWSKTSPAYPEINPVTKAGALPGTWQNSHLSMYLVIGPLTGNPTVDPKADPCPSTTLLSKVLKSVQSTKGPDRIHTH